MHASSTASMHHTENLVLWSVGGDQSSYGDILVDESYPLQPKPNFYGSGTPTQFNVLWEFGNRPILWLSRLPPSSLWCIGTCKVLSLRSAVGKPNHFLPGLTQLCDLSLSQLDPGSLVSPVCVSSADFFFNMAGLLAQYWKGTARFVVNSVEIGNIWNKFP